jgi:streptomycin 6-kinase
VDGVESVLLLAREWELDLGERLSGGTESHVYAVGDDAVLRIDKADDETFGARVAVLRAASGRGYVRLLRHDAEYGATLMERLQPFAATPDDVRTTLDLAWDVAVDVVLDTAVDKAERLAEFIERYWLEFDRPCPRSRVDRALACCASRADAYDRADAVVVHGDAQTANLLRRADGELAFVDPEPFHCERAYDVAVALRLADADGQPDAVREWHTIERLSTGLECLRKGYDELGRDLLDNP